MTDERFRILVVAFLVLGGCSSAVTRPVAPGGTPNEKAETPAIDSEAPARIDTSTFVLELASDASGAIVTVDQPTNIALVLEGRGGYHINLEYPLYVELAGSAAELEKNALRSVDASELSETRARFATRVRWTAAGQRWVAARVRFAMCTPDTCVPHEETVAIVLHVR